MIKKLGFAAAMSVLLLSGCGGGSSSNTTPNTIEIAHKKLIGTWLQNAQENGCYADTNTSSGKTILTFSQNDVSIKDFEYNNATCDSSGLTKNVIETYEYAIEGTGLSTTGKKFYKTSFTKTGISIIKGSITDPDELKTGQVIKLGLLFDGDHLVFSDKEETPDQYGSDFNLSEYLIKQ